MPARAVLESFVHGSPPWIDASFELELENTSAQPCWFLLPYRHNGQQPAPGELSEVWLFTLDADPRIRHLALFDLGLRAFLLPALGKLRLRQLVLSARPAIPLLWVVESDRLLVGGEPVARLFSERLVCPQEVEAADARDWTVVEEVAAEAALSFDERARHRLLVAPIPEA